MSFWEIIAILGLVLLILIVVLLAILVLKKSSPKETTLSPAQYTGKHTRAALIAICKQHNEWTAFCLPEGRSENFEPDLQEMLVKCVSSATALRLHPRSQVDPKAVLLLKAFEQSFLKFQNSHADFVAWRTKREDFDRKHSGLGLVLDMAEAVTRALNRDFNKRGELRREEQAIQQEGTALEQQRDAIWIEYFALVDRLQADGTALREAYGWKLEDKN